MPNNKKIITRIGVSSNQEIWITERNFEGVDYIDVRKFYFDPPKNSTSHEDAKRPEEFFKPTKKGISLTPGQWALIVEYLPKKD